MNFKPGDRYNFDDGAYIEVIQIKNAEYQGENTQVVTFIIGTPKNLPRKLVMGINQFTSNFSHLFQDNAVKEPISNFAGSLFGDNDTDKK